MNLHVKNGRPQCRPHDGTILIGAPKKARRFTGAHVTRLIVLRGLGVKGFNIKAPCQHVEATMWSFGFLEFQE